MALAYKAVNTLDSMIGHKNKRYKEFGYSAAKIDDAVNWLPSRFCYVLICLASVLTGFNAQAAFRTGARELNSKSTIGSLSEAAFAGALEVRLGGTNVYQGRVDVKAYLGKAIRTLEPELIKSSVRLMVCLAWVLLFFSIMINFLIQKGLGEL